jgi:hypothetical protein
MNKPTIDLHSLNGFGKYIDQHDVWHALDKFIVQTKLNKARQIKSGLHVQIAIIVGKGLQSKNLIEGKNPLRYFAESYLNTCNYKWKTADFLGGGDGTIFAEII